MCWFLKRCVVSAVNNPFFIYLSSMQQAIKAWVLSRNELHELLLTTTDWRTLEYLQSILGVSLHCNSLISFNLSDPWALTCPISSRFSLMWWGQCQGLILQPFHGFSQCMNTCGKSLILMQQTLAFPQISAKLLQQASQSLWSIIPWLRNARLTLLQLVCSSFQPYISY